MKSFHEFVIITKLKNPKETAHSANVVMCLKGKDCDVANWILLGCCDTQFGDVASYPRRRHTALSNCQWATLVGFCVQIMNLRVL